MNISSKLKRVRAQADHLFLRGGRTDVLGELRTADDKADSLRVLCEALRSAVEKTLHTHNTPEEKRIRKVADSHGAETLKDALHHLSQQSISDQLQSGHLQAGRPMLLLRDVVEQMAECQQALSLEVLKYDELVEAEVLSPLNRIIKEDFTNCAKLKKQLKQAGQDLDSARSRYRNSLNAATTQATTTKLDTYKEEMDDAETKLEQFKDNYACELFTLLSKEREMCQLVDQFLKVRQDFLLTSTRQLNVVLPKLEQQLEESHTGPVYGCRLGEHLRVTNKNIAVPMEICLKRLVEIGLQEEGLFRMAGSASKVKRLKGAFDANLIDESTFTANGDDYNKDYDVHVIAGAFKWYLRELPEPLLTYTLHADWLEAIKTPDRDAKLRQLWSVVKRLPGPNFNNLSYVIQFMSLLASYQTYNKMTPNNIAIVIAPNLIWAQEESKIDDISGILGINMALGNLYRQIVEQLIECADYFFEPAINFGVPKMVPSSPDSSTHNGSVAPAASQGAAHPSYVTLPRAGHRRGASEDFNKLDMSMSGINLDNSVRFGECESPKQPQRRKKQAPLPPQGTCSSSSPEQQRSQLMPTREAPTPLHLRPYPSKEFSNTPAKESVPNTPVPAVRLHHTGSIRRPNIEPPKPPVIGGLISVPKYNQFNNSTSHPSQAHSLVPIPITTTSNTSGTTVNKPPRPQPPAISALEKSSSANVLQAHNLASTVASEASMSSSVESWSSSLSAASSTGAEGSSAEPVPSGGVAHNNEALEAHKQTPVARHPIGFEHLDDKAPVASEEQSDPADVTLRSKQSQNSSDIGFVLDDSDITGAGNVSNLSPSKVFRKSLENVIQQQASGQPLVLPKHQGSSSSSSSNQCKYPDDTRRSDEDLTSNACLQDVSNEAEETIQCAAIQASVPPVPAVRTMRENIQTSSTCADRPEPAVRHDKPALPEKPSTLPRPPSAERPPIGPRPYSNPNVKVPPATNTQSTAPQAASDASSSSLNASGSALNASGSALNASGSALNDSDSSLDTALDDTASTDELLESAGTPGDDQLQGNEPVAAVQHTEEEETL